MDLVVTLVTHSPQPRYFFIFSSRVCGVIRCVVAHAVALCIWYGMACYGTMDPTAQYRCCVIGLGHDTHGNQALADLSALYNKERTVGHT